MTERLYYLGFSNFSGIGPLRFAALLARFGSAKAAWEASGKDLQEVLKEVLTAKFIAFRQEFSFENYQERMKKAGVTFLTSSEKAYPKLLKQITNPPFILYIKGSYRFDDSNHRSTIAVVGTRKITQYGRDVTVLFTQELVAHGFTIVSGLALGVDAIAHGAALENDGKTIAVLGCGVDCCTPGENQSLYNSIIEKGGCIISEFSLGEVPTVGSFPARNRIVAGLSEGVVVTEGAEDSGALITADFAFQFGRRVFAVPGPITSTLSKGPYKLIQKGAKLVTSPEDILREFQISNDKYPISNKKTIKGETQEEQKVLDLLQNEPLHFDEIVLQSRMSASKVGSLLSIMEIKGIVKSSDGAYRI